MIITNTSRIDNILFQLYFLMTVFFIPYSYRQVTYIFMFIMVLIHILIVKKNENALTMKGKYLLFMMAVLFFCGFAILTSEYSQFYLIMAYFPILIVFLWEKNGLLRLGRMNERILCYFVLILFMIENIALYISIMLYRFNSLIIYVFEQFHNNRLQILLSFVFLLQLFL